MGPKNKDASATLLVIITFGFEISSNFTMGVDPRYVHEPDTLQIDLFEVNDRNNKKREINHGM